MHTPKKKKKKKKWNKKKGAQLTKHDAFGYWSSSCPPWWWATVRRLGTCFSGLLHVGGLPRTVLTENICRCVQQTLQHFTTKMPFLTTSKNLPNMMPSGYWSSSPPDGRRLEAWHLLLRTASRPSRLGQYWQKIFADVFNKHSNISRQKCPF